MKKNDWIGIGLSLGLHALLIVLLGVMTLAAAEPQALGYIEVDFGPLAEGRPVQRAVETQPRVPDRKPQPRRQPRPRAVAPRETKPVDLPDQQIESKEVERVKSPQTKTIAPEPQKDRNVAEVKKPDPEPEKEQVETPPGGAAEGTAGATEGASGSGSDVQKTAPYQIEGLNRSPINAPLPRYAEKVNATVRIQITVDPQGRIINRRPVLKGTPALDQAVMDALQRWRFNALPSNVPQQSQTGTITFRFRLE